MTEKTIKKNLMHNYTEKQRNEAYKLVQKVKDHVFKLNYDKYKEDDERINAVKDIIKTSEEYKMTNGLLLSMVNYTNDYDSSSKLKSYEPLEIAKERRYNPVETLAYYLEHIEDHSQLPTAIFMEFILRYNSDPKMYTDKIINRMKSIYPWDENGNIKDKYKDGWYYGSYYKTEFVDQ